MHILAKWWLPAIALACASPGFAVPVDGVLDPEYGGPRSVQTTQTSLGEIATNLTGSELDAAFAYVANDTLWLLFAGNFNRPYTEPIYYPNSLHLYIDVAPGGQSSLSSANPSVGHTVNLLKMAGLGFDIDFAPDYWLSGARNGGGGGGYPLYGYYAELPTGGGGSGYWLGISPNGGPGTFVSYPTTSNPFGIMASLDPSNTGGVGGGCDAGSGAGATTGIEWAVPLAALGNPVGPIRICALIVTNNGVDSSLVSNQVLGPVPPGTCALGPAAGVDFANVPGAQYFTIDAVTPVVRTTWGRIKTIYR